MLFNVCPVLAGILIAIVVVIGLALGLPWVMSAQAAESELEGDPTMRLLSGIVMLRLIGRGPSGWRVS